MAGLCANVTFREMKVLSNKKDSYLANMLQDVGYYSLYILRSTFTAHDTARY